MGQARAPRKIDVQKAEKVMVLDWGTEGVWRLPMAVIRKMCPCALCTDVRGQADEVSVELHMMEGLEATATDELESVKPVGRYAIQIRWQDGHDTGIYTFEYLRRLGQLEGEQQAEA